MLLIDPRGLGRMCWAGHLQRNLTAYVIVP